MKERKTLSCSPFPLLPSVNVFGPHRKSSVLSCKHVCTQTNTLNAFLHGREGQGSSSSQQLVKGHIKQGNNYICLKAKSSHPRPARAGRTLHILNWWTRPRRCGTKLMVNKTTQSLKHYSLINHTHLCRRIRRTLSLWCLNPNWKPGIWPQSLPHTLCSSGM